MKRRGFLRVILGAPAAVVIPAVATIPAVESGRTGLSTVDGYIVCHPAIDAEPLLEMCAERRALIDEMVAAGHMTNIEIDGGWPPYDYEDEEE